MVGDIQCDYKRYEKDKNEFTRRVPIPKGEENFYKDLTKGKSAGSPLFPLYDNDGKQLDKRGSSKYVQNIIRSVSSVAGLREDNKRYTSHSTRRLYAQSLYNSTRYVSRGNLRKMIGKYINNQGSNKERILKRIESEKKRLNYYRLKLGKEKKILPGRNYEGCMFLYI